LKQWHKIFISFADKQATLVIDCENTYNVPLSNMATIGSTGQMVIGQSQKERTVMVSFKNNIQHGIMILDLIIVYFIHILLSYKTRQMDKTQVVNF